MKTVFRLLAAMALLVVAIVAGAKFAEESIKKASQCAVGGALLAPVNIVKGGINLTGGILGAGIDAVGGVAGGIGGILGIGDDDKLSAEQAQIAATIVGVGVARGESQRNITIALMGPWPESQMQNLPYGDRDSIGPYQMRPSQGWGTVEELSDPEYQANKFYSVMHEKFTQEQIDSRPMWQTVADVLKPAAEHRHKYDDYKEIAAEIAAGLLPDAAGSMVLIGDSITEGMTYSMAQYLRQSGWGEVTVDTPLEAERKIASPGLFGSRSGIGVIRERISNDFDPDLWVIDLGSYDAAAITEKQQALELIQKLLDEIPEDKPVAWVNLHLPGVQGAALFNQALKEAADNSPFLAVVDWSKYASSASGELLSTDNFHYTAKGYEQRSALVSQVVSDPESYFDGLDSNIFSKAVKAFKIPGSCEFGETVLSSVVDVLTGEIGNPSVNLEEYDGLFDWAFSQQDLDFVELINDGDVIESFNEANIGDFIFWADDPENPEEITRTGIYLGGNTVIVEPEDGELIVISQMNWSGVVRIVRIDAQYELQDLTNLSLPVVDYADTVIAGGIRVHTAIADQVTKMVNDAGARGVNLAGGGWRSVETTIDMRRNACGPSQYDIYERPNLECTPPTAKPGTSMHERGLAIDFTCDGTLITSRSNKCFTWLVENAARYGLINYEVEPWHWSTNGK